ncbi:Abhydrolase-2 domain-containing protein [Sulfidibacter corallicola]|uniref:Phospholipase/carboxylesterase/thioesterase domain-containing protein n=1 Tax=Sulfidibacter corallicola TaxID=2818388 RepID=A0A8A4TQ46_SULCO|nr:hypothetical protein J3U87_06410 [Sulfidibacter corallicola]
MPERNLDLTWRVSYELEGDDSGEILILLHGFGQRGAVIQTKLQPFLKNMEAMRIAPDAPFPIPEKTAGGFRLGFTWYFFDPKTGIYHVDMQQAVTQVSALVRAMDWWHRPKRVIGYSQGGYLAPFVGLALERVTQVIGINCRFRAESLTGKLPFRLDAVHGARDLMVDPKRAASCHGEILERGNEGEFHLVEGAGHGIGDDIGRAVERQILNFSI